MNVHKKDLPVFMPSLWLYVIVLLSRFLAPPLVYSAENQVQENIELVRQWLEIVVDGDLSKSNQFLSNEYTVHENNELIVMSPEERAQQNNEKRQQRGQSSFHQLELFGERDKVVAIYSLKTSDAPISLVQIFRVKGAKIEETWVGTVATGVLWEWNADIYGDTDSKANALVLHRWYDEIYKEANWQLVPEVAGPNYIRHEISEHQMTGEEYSQRLRSLFKIFGGFSDIEDKYEIIAGADKIAVIGKWLDTTFTQAWRVKDGKLVESWWGFFSAGELVKLFVLLILIPILIVVINIILWGIIYWRRWRRNRPLKLIGHFLLPLFIDIVLVWLILFYIPNFFNITFTLTLSAPYIALELLTSGTVVTLIALIRIIVYITFARRKE